MTGGNERLVLAALHGRAPVTRADLAVATGLPKTTVIEVVARMLRRGTLIEQPAEAAPGRRGRKPAGLTPAGPPGRIGVLAFSHTGVRVAVSGPAGRLATRRYAPLDRTTGEAARADRAVELLTAIAGDDLRGVVVGRPVPVDRLDHDLSAALAARLGIPVTTENDANLGALGEAGHGAGRGLESFVYVKVTDGLGAGLYLNGRLHRGVAGLAGELAHVQVLDEGPRCPCGGRGCLVHTFGPPSPRPAHFSEVLRLTAAGETGARRIAADAGRRLGRVLAHTCTMLCPQALIVNSALGAATPAFLGGIREMIERHTAPAVAAAVQVLAAVAGDDAELLGALSLARSETLLRHHP
ncbi:MAG: ROK family transcriptional regulator [Actinoplanes sp.]